MSTDVTYREAMKELGVSRSTVERRLRLTRVPVRKVDGLAYFDLDTLRDAWAGHRAAIEQEKAEREKSTERSITVSVPLSMRDELDAMASRHGVSLAAVVREILGNALH